MIHRILMGADTGSEQGAIKMAIDLLRKSAILAAWDLSPGGFFNCVRVLSLPNVVTPDDQAGFDAMLDREGRDFGVIHRNDVGAFLGVVGTIIQPPSP
jgi:hypothetical protein